MARLQCTRWGRAPAERELSPSFARREIDRVIAFARIKRPTIDGHAFNRGGDQQIRIGVAVAVSVGWQIIGEKKIADVEELRDGLAVISSHTGRGILRRLDSPGRCFDEQTGNRDRRADCAYTVGYDRSCPRAVCKRGGLRDMQLIWKRGGSGNSEF